MNKNILTAIFLIFCLLNTKGQNILRDSLFNYDWKFQKGSIQEAKDPDFDDSKWTKIDLPHD
jgi:hypothetical protein